ncbi:MAG: ABC transporter substrate-binding protein [Betaproteobacteria bacterium]|jgi:ABC-type branched-subunit amino acid transport system substrate-binding protein|nr:ABC transporter substrate-binding protein [Betaproteobacteria bacterium]
MPIRLLTSILFAFGIALGIAPPAGAQTPGVTANSVLLGQSAAFSGPAAQLGIQMNAGAMAYFDYINKLGGVHGRTILLKTRDDRYEGNLAAENTRKLIEEDKVFALFAYVGTPTSAAALPIFTEAKVPFVGPFTGAELLRKPLNRYVFNVRASYYDETEKIVEQLVSTGIHKIAVFYQNDSYGKAGLTGVQIAMKKRNLAIAATGTVERNTTDVGAAVKAISAVQPDAVVMISAYTSIAEFVRQMKKAGSAAQFHNVSFVGSKALANALGAEGYGVVISQVVPFPWYPGVPVVKEYQRILKAAGITEYNFGSLEGYLAAKVMVEGLRRAGRDLTRERLIAALETMDNVDLGGFVVSFSRASHAGSDYVELTMIGRDGKFVR